MLDFALLRTSYTAKKNNLSVHKCEFFELRDLFLLFKMKKIKIHHIRFQTLLLHIFEKVESDLPAAAGGDGTNNGVVGDDLFLKKIGFDVKKKLKLRLKKVFPQNFDTFCFLNAF